MFKGIQLEDLVRYSVAGITLAGVILFGIVCVSLFYRGSLNSVSRQMAYELAPPQYPESILIDQHIGGGPTSQWDLRTYETSDDVMQVLEYMGSHKFPLSEDTTLPIDGPVYTGYACNETQEAKEIANQIVLNHYEWVDIPCASLMVYVREGKTEIQVRISWPSD